MTRRYVTGKKAPQRGGVDSAEATRRLGYARVSTILQGADGAGIASQRALLESAGVEPSNVYVEVGSGRRADNRPVLNALLDDLCKSGGALVVAKLDRLARSSVDAGRIADHLAKCGVQLVVLDIGLDTSTAVGRAMFSMIATMAQLESDLISERTSGARAAIRSGLAEGSLGGRQLKFDREEALRLVSEGQSYSSVARLVGTTKSSVADVVKRDRLARTVAQ